MPPRLHILTICAALLAACTNIGPPPVTVSHSVGFTGIGSEFLGVQARPGSVPTAVLAQRSLVAAPVAVHVPVIDIQSMSSNPSVQASRAIRSGGMLDTNSVRVNAAGRDLHLSIVRVNGDAHAVFRAPRRKVLNVGPTTIGTIAAQMPALTGCTVAGRGYSFGPTRPRSVAVAIPVRCP